MQFIEITFSDKTLMLDMDKVVVIEQSQIKEVKPQKENMPITYKGSIIIYHQIGNTEIEIVNIDRKEAEMQFNQIYSKLYNFIRKRQKSIEKVI